MKYYRKKLLNVIELNATKILKKYIKNVTK